MWRGVKVKGVVSENIRVYIINIRTDEEKPHSKNAESELFGLCIL
jgi:hypothetical protein